MSHIYNVEDYGAIADYQQIHDAAITAGQLLLNSPSAPFAPGDVGKLVLIESAGSAGSVLFSKISSYNAPNQVVLHDAAGGTATAAKLQYSTDSTPAIQAAINLAKVTGGDVRFNFAGMYGVTHLDATNPTRAFAMTGIGAEWWGTRLIPMANGHAVLDLVGHDAFSMKNVAIGGGSGQLAMPNFGILSAPSTIATGIDVLSLDHCTLDGVFLNASAYFDRVYGGSTRDSGFGNYWQHGAPGTSYTAVFTKRNVLNATSQFATILPITSPDSSNSIINWSFGGRTEFHNLDANGGAGNANTLYLDGLGDSTWTGGIIAGGYTSPIVFGPGCSGLVFINVEFSTDTPVAYPYVFSGETPDEVVLLNINAVYATSLHSMPMTNLTQIGRQYT
jgi:hypothetical protein